jgi:hypothetical protein
MKRIALSFACLALAALPALAADYETSEKTPLYQLGLKVPAAAMDIEPLKALILARYKADADQTRSDAKEDKDGNPDFHPYDVETSWRVTYDSEAVLSLSASTDADTGGAHPNQGYQTIVWDKKAGRAVALEELFAPEQEGAALAAIDAAATRAWNKIYTERAGQPPGPDSDTAGAGIGPDPEKLKHYALTYAKGQHQANGIVLLYGAGQVWPHVLGEFRLSVPAAVFAKYLKPQWQAVFAPG